jgi:hypothetical protein
MKSAHAAFTLCFLGGIAGVVYLVIHDHPWFAFFVLMVTGCLSVKSSGGEVQ